MRLRSLVALSAVAALAVPSTASAGAPVGEPLQAVAGTVAVPNPTKAAQNVTRVSRTAGLAGAATNGVVGWFFKVDPQTIGGEFTLTTPAPDADYDVLFYSDPGTLADAPTSVDFLGTSGTGERGIVPANTTHVLVYPAAGVNTAFTYQGYAPAQIAIGADSLDLTVVPGATVKWVNQTADYTFVSGPGFNSGTGPGQGIPVGSTFTHEFTEAGTFAYSTSAGTGTITVAAP